MCSSMTRVHVPQTAGSVLGEAVAWLTAQQAAGRTDFGAGTGQARRELATELQTALGVGSETARGMVTKLKLKKLLA